MADSDLSSDAAAASFVVLEDHLSHASPQSESCLDSIALEREWNMSQNSSFSSQMIDDNLTSSEDGESTAHIVHSPVSKSIPIPRPGSAPIMDKKSEERAKDVRPSPPTTSAVNTAFQLVQGEQTVTLVRNLQWQARRRRPKKKEPFVIVNGTLYLTNMRLHFVATSKEELCLAKRGEPDIDYGMVAQLIKSGRSVASTGWFDAGAGPQDLACSLVIRLRIIRMPYIFTFIPQRTDATRGSVCDVLTRLCFPSSPTKTFAFESFRSNESTSANDEQPATLPHLAQLFDPVAEYQRLGVQCGACKCHRTASLFDTLTSSKSAPSLEKIEKEAVDERCNSVNTLSKQQLTRKSEGQTNGAVSYSADNSEDDDCTTVGEKDEPRGNVLTQSDTLSFGRFFKSVGSTALDYFGAKDKEKDKNSSSGSVVAPNAHTPHLPSRASPDTDAEAILAHARKNLQACSECSGWRVSMVNKSFDVCASYPSVLVVPSTIPDCDLRVAASFRSKERFPVLCWRHAQNGATLSRCSQPRTGVYRQRGAGDEYLIQAIRMTNHTVQKLFIVDARPLANAFANFALGAGYENVNYYPGCTIEFLGVPNIHVVRAGYERLHDLVQQRLCNQDTCPRTWLSSLEATSWLEHLCMVLKGATRIASLLHSGGSVLLHCSDGWDRTSQLAALAQLMLDPYYRTTVGFCTLLEKEWICAGYKFSERLGQCVPVGSSPEQAPILLQFFECVYNMIIQFPLHFEFTEEFLAMLVIASHSNRFSTFMFNNEREREEFKVRYRSQSLWRHLFARTDEPRWQNPFYDARAHAADSKPLPVSSGMDRVRLWTGLHLSATGVDAERRSVLDAATAMRRALLRQRGNEV